MSGSCDETLTQRQFYIGRRTRGISTESGRGKESALYGAEKTGTDFCNSQRLYTVRFSPYRTPEYPHTQIIVQESKGKEELTTEEIHFLRDNNVGRLLHLGFHRSILPSPTHTLSTLSGENLNSVIILHYCCVGNDRNLSSVHICSKFYIHEHPLY